MTASRRIHWNAVATNDRVLFAILIPRVVEEIAGNMV